MGDSATVRVRVRSHFQHGHYRGYALGDKPGTHSALFWTRAWTEKDVPEALADELLADHRLEVQLMPEAGESVPEALADASKIDESKADKKRR